MASSILTALVFERAAPTVETQVKERLTGAVILVTLIVLLVPELLTGPGRKAEPVSSPAGAGSQSSVIIDLVNGGVRPVATPEAQPDESSLEARRIVPAPGKPVKREEEKSPVAASLPPPVQVAPPAQAPPVERPAAVSSSREGWTVQLGSFASRDNAQRLVRELKGKGFEAFMLEGGGTSGKLYRVRVGPERDRDAAAALAARLRLAGQPGSLVSP